MGNEAARVVFDFESNMSGFNRGMNSAQSRITGMGNSFSKLAKIASAAFAVKEIVSFTKSCVDLGSDLSEIQNVVDVTFNSLSSKVNEFAKSSITSFGLSETVAKKYMGTLGAMSKSMGFSEQQAYKMSESITGLAGDVASFYNISSDEALTKLKSIWTGETESLKELGVVMTQANLDTYALANGFGKVIQDMSESEKVMLRYQYVTSSLAAAQGDFSRTSGSWANQVRVLSLQFDSLKATIGQGLINVFTPIIKVINTLLSKLQVAAQLFKRFTELITGKKSDSSGESLASNTSVASDNLSSASDNAGGISKNTDKTAKNLKKVEKSLMGFDKINKLSAPSESSDSGGSSGPSGGVSDLGGGLADSVSSAGVFDDLDKSLDKKIGILTSKFKNWVGTLPKLDLSFDWALIKSNLQAGLKSIWDTLVTLTTFSIVIGIKISNDLDVGALVTSFSSLFASATNLANVFTGTLAPALQNFYDVGISPIVQWIGGKLVDAFSFASTIMDDWASWFTENKSAIADFGTKIGEAVNFAWSLIEPLADVAWETFKTVLSGISEGVQAVFGWLVNNGDTVKTVLEGLTVAVVAVTAAMIAYKSTLAIQAVIDAIRNGTILLTAATMAQTVAQTALNIAMSINPIALVVAAIVGLVAVFVILWKKCDWFRNFWIKLFNGIRTIASTVIKAIAGFFSSAAKTIRSIFSKAAGFFGGVLKGIKNVFVNMPTWFEDKFNSAVTKIKTVFSVSNIKTFFSTVWSAITGVFSGITSWFKDKFAAAWSAVKGVFSAGGKIFSGIKDGIASVFKTVVNKIISGINTVISVPFKAINKMLNKIRDVGIAGVKPFSSLWGHNPLDVPQIPELAKGGYIKANAPQLAMVGDNRHQGEIVAPEDKLLELALKAAALVNGNNHNDTKLLELLKIIIKLIESLDLNFNLDGDMLTKKVVDKINRNTQITGKCQINI